MLPSNRSYHHGSNFVPKAALLPDSIGEEYRAGQRLLELSIKHKVAPQTVAQKLRMLGIKIKTYRTPFYVSKGSKSRKLTAEQIELILKRDSEDVHHAKIAEEIGNISRERIRQICKSAGNATRHSRMYLTQDRAALVEVRNQQRAAKVDAMSKAWIGGASFTEIGELAELSKNGIGRLRGGQYVSYLRRRHGVKKFPYRQPKHWAIKPSRKKIEKCQT